MYAKAMKWALLWASVLVGGCGSAESLESQKSGLMAQDRSKPEHRFSSVAEFACGDTIYLPTNAGTVVYYLDYLDGDIGAEARAVLDDPSKFRCQASKNRVPGK